MSGPLSLLSSRRGAALLLLGFSSGLPLAISSDLLAAWLSEAGVDVTRIGLLGMVALPYALKFAWSPLADRYVPPFLGRRRGWLLISQIFLIAAILCLARVNPVLSLYPFAALMTAVALASATQDIVIDAWRTDVLPPVERGTGAAINIAGYRIGMIASGAGALWMHGKLQLSWSVICDLLAASLAVGCVGTWLAAEPVSARPPRSLSEAIAVPLRELLDRPGGWVLLVFVLVFKLPEQIAAAMSLPFLLKLGISTGDVATIRQGFGMAMTLAGAFLGGGIVARLGVTRSLWIFAIAHSVSNLTFCALARAGPNYAGFVATIGVENLCVGLTAAGFAAWMMGQCDPRYSAFQFALLSGLMAMGRVGASSLSGVLAAHLGWASFFAVSALFGLPGLVLLGYVPHVFCRDQTHSEVAGGV